MKTRSLMLLGLAAGCGLLAMVLFQRARGSTEGGEQKIKVLVSTAEISPGTALNEKNCEFREYPISMVPDGAVTTPEEYEGRAVKVRTFPGDIIILDKLSNGTGASNDIPAGMQVTSINVDKTMTHSGLLLPGDRVNVTVTLSILPGQYAGLGKQIKTVLEFVEVFATDNRREIDSADGESNTSTVSLLVTDEEAKLVKLAEAVGKLSLTLRSKEDKNPNSTPPEERFQASEMVNYFSDGEEESEEEGDDNDAVPQEPAPEPEPVVQEPQPKDDLTAFLDANLEPEPAPEPAAPAPIISMEPEPEKWKVEILAGDQRIVEEFDLPVDKSKVPKPETGNPIIDRVRSLFRAMRKPKPRKPITVFGENTANSSSEAPAFVPFGEDADETAEAEDDSDVDSLSEDFPEGGENDAGGFTEDSLRVPLGS